MADSVLAMAGQLAKTKRLPTRDIKIIDVYSQGLKIVTLETYTTRPMQSMPERRQHAEDIIVAAESELGKAGQKEYMLEFEEGKKQKTFRKIIEQVYAMPLEEAAEAHAALVQVANTKPTAGHFSLRLNTKKKVRGKNKPKSATDADTAEVRPQLNSNESVSKFSCNGAHTTTSTTMMALVTWYSLQMHIV